MKIKQAFRDIKKPKEINQDKLNEYLTKLYGTASFSTDDTSYVNNSNPRSVTEYKQRVILLIDKLVKLSGNEKFNQLKAQFEKKVFPGETRNILDEIKKTAEAMCYKLEHGQFSSQEKFKAEINSSTLSACEAGALTNMQKILYSMDSSIYNQKYNYIQSLALEYVRAHTLSDYVGNEVHVANELIHEISNIYNVVPPRDIHARYRDLAAPANEKFTKHADFLEYLEKHFSSREGIYSFVNNVSNSHLSKLPDPLKNKKFATKASGTTNDTSELEQINAVADSLNIPVTSIIQYSKDGSEFEYKEDYIPVIKAATMHDLLSQGFIEQEPLTIKTTEIFTITARDTFERDSNNKLQKVHIPAKTTTTEKVNTIIQTEDGWYLADKVEDKIDPGRRLLDTSKLQELTIDGQNIEDYLHEQLRVPLAAGIGFENALRVVIEQCNNRVKQNDPDITKELILLSDQTQELKRILPPEEIASIDIQDINNWIEFDKLLKEKSPSALANLLEYDDNNWLNINLRNYAKQLTKAMPPIDTQDDKHSSAALMYAAQNGKLKAVEKLIKAGANVNATKEYGDTTLIYAAINGHTGIVAKLSAAGAYVNLQNLDGNTALTHAAQNGHTETVEKLIEAGAHVNAKNKDSTTALMYAAQNGKLEAVEKLINARADLNAKDKNGNTALHLAAHNGHTGIVTKLIAEGADVHAKDKDGNTALTHAAQNGHTEIVTKFIAEGADVHATNKTMDIAIKNNRINITKILLSSGKIAPSLFNRIKYTMFSKDNEHNQEMRKYMQNPSVYILKNDEINHESKLKALDSLSKHITIANYFGLNNKCKTYIKQLNLLKEVNKTPENDKDEILREIIKSKRKGLNVNLHLKNLITGENADITPNELKALTQLKEVKGDITHTTVRNTLRDIRSCIRTR